MSEEDSGLLGNLPKTRPGVETPRRAAARQRRAEPQAGTTAAGGDRAGAPGDESGFEQLARAGAGLAGGAAAAGFRLAGRALDELGKAVGRR
jgi:hypothetical protein